MAHPQKRTSIKRSDNKGSNHGNDEVGNMAGEGVEGEEEVSCLFTGEEIDVEVRLLITSSSQFYE